MRTIISTLMTLCMLCMSSTQAQDEKHGYWWKKEAPPEQTEDADSKNDLYKDLTPPPIESTLDKLHPKEVEKLISDYRSYAVWKPTEEHVTWYYQLQDYARRRALAFTNTTSVVMLTHPELNVQTQYPNNRPGQDARDLARERSIDTRLSSARDSAALVMLSRRGCEYCDAQRTSLKYFQEKHGWEVKEIDINERPDLASRFAVQYTPTTVVIFRNSDQWMPVAVGVQSVPSIEDGVYRMLRLIAGETTVEQFSVQEEEQGGVFDPQRAKQ